ncbi:hypothetical protein V6N13_114633 [Hibiscus sabdariffa]
MAFFLSISLLVLLLPSIWILLLDVIWTDLRCTGLRFHTAVPPIAFFPLFCDGLKTCEGFFFEFLFSQNLAKAVFCARVVILDYRDLTPSWFNLVVCFFGRRSWTVQGPGPVILWVLRLHEAAHSYGFRFWALAAVVPRVIWRHELWIVCSALLTSTSAFCCQLLHCIHLSQRRRPPWAPLPLPPSLLLSFILFITQLPELMACFLSWQMADSPWSWSATQIHSLETTRRIHGLLKGVNGTPGFLERYFVPTSSSWRPTTIGLVPRLNPVVSLDGLTHTRIRALYYWTTLTWQLSRANGGGLAFSKAHLTIDIHNVLMGLCADFYWLSAVAAIFVWVVILMVWASALISGDPSLCNRLPFLLNLEWAAPIWTHPPWIISPPAWIQLFCQPELLRAAWLLPQLLSAMDNLNFTAEEAEAVISDVPSDEEDNSSWLVGSVVILKPINGDSVIRVFRSVWKAKNIHEIVELRPNFFLIKPSSIDAREMIFKRRPWVYHDEFFSIKPYNPALIVEDYDFLLMTIWIRVYRLPLRAMNRDMGLRLGGCVGEFLRILVRVDIRKPLRRCVLLGNAPGKPATPCPLRYERLPEFCYFCGLVGHALATCPSKPTNLDEKQLQYGSWLRVQNQHPRLGPRRRTGIEYFTEPAPVSIEPTPVDASATAAPTPSNAGTDTVGTAYGGPVMATAAEVPMGQDIAVVIDTAQGPPGAATETDTTAVPADATAGAGTTQAAADVTALHRTEPVNGLRHVEGEVNSRAKEVPPPAPSPVLPSTSPTRVSKRSLQGKYEVCTPIQPKRSRLLHTTLPCSDGKDAGMSSLNSSTEVAEVSGQPVEHHEDLVLEL